MPEVIFSRASLLDGLAVTVTADWPNGRFTVLFTDTDSGNDIERRVYSNPESAQWFANKLIPEITP
jgi:hypothetical protein